MSGENEPEVRGVALDRDQVQLSVHHIPDRPGTAAALCSSLADNGISIDAIVQSERQHADAPATSASSCAKKTVPGLTLLSPPYSPNGLALL